MTVEVIFWGVRGSAPCASKEYEEVGGHTSCVSLHNEKEIVILDAGTGLLDLGHWIEKQNFQRATLLITHFHYDHILGFPFFQPIWREGFDLDVYANNFEEKGSLRNFFENILFSHPTFPVTFDQIKANIKLSQFKVGETFEIKEGAKIDTRPLNHPGKSTGFRINIQNKIISYITDTEHTPGETDQNVLDLIKEADLMIYDSTYTEQEWEAKKGWGHSTWEEAIRLARLADVKQLALFHHDIMHTDEIMKKIEFQAQSLWDKAFVAKQGLSVKLA